VLLKPCAWSRFEAGSGRLSGDDIVSVLSLGPEQTGWEHAGDRLIVIFVAMPLLVLRLGNQASLAQRPLPPGHTATRRCSDSVSDCLCRCIARLADETILCISACFRSASLAALVPYSGLTRSAHINQDVLRESALLHSTTSLGW
jgi:hypothetical protein